MENRRKLIIDIKKGDLFMRFVLLILMITMLLSCKDDMAGPLKGGTIITVKGDTIEFYGGTLTYIGFGTRSIRDIAVNDLKEKGN